MDLKLILLISVVTPTIGFLVLLLTKKNPQTNRRIFLMALPFMFLIDIFIAYKFAFLPRLEASRAQDMALEKFPFEAQKFALTRLCQNVQKEFFKDHGLSEVQLNTSMLPICTCISAHLMSKSEFKKIERAASDGATFSSIYESHTNLLTETINTCGSKL